MKVITGQNQNKVLRKIKVNEYSIGEVVMICDQQKFQGLHSEGEEEEEAAVSKDGCGLLTYKRF